MNELSGVVSLVNMFFTRSVNNDMAVSGRKNKYGIKNTRFFFLIVKITRQLHREDVNPYIPSIMEILIIVM